MPQICQKMELDIGNKHDLISVFMTVGREICDDYNDL